MPERSSWEYIKLSIQIHLYSVSIVKVFYRLATITPVGRVRNRVAGIWRLQALQVSLADKVTVSKNMSLGRCQPKSWYTIPNHTADSGYFPDFCLS